MTLGPGRNLLTGESTLRRFIGEEPTTLEVDLLTVASAIYGADLHCLRAEREDYQRGLALEIPVINRSALEAVKEDIERTLFLLSGDSWQLTFRSAPGQPEATRLWDRRDGSTLLFSGGLDSLAQALALVSDGATGVLVSHDSGSVILRQSQIELGAEVRTLSKKRLEHCSFRVMARKSKGQPFPTKREPSQRSRSFLFLVIGALVARRTGNLRMLFIAENGQMAIHLPLTEARIGGFSTRTAHPGVIARLERLLSQVLGVELDIVNPFLYLTKAEVVADACSNFPLLVEKSVSCWRSSRLPGGYRHCGDCIPCLIRRIALERNGMLVAEWQRDLFQEELAALPQEDVGKRNAMELLEFIVEFDSGQSMSELAMRRPEILDQSFDGAKAVEMYRRFAREAVDVLSGYPGVSCLM